jgi:hypothetical protein
MLLADVAGDSGVEHRPELVLLSGGRLVVLQPPSTVALPFLPATITSFASGDLDGDGRVDLLALAPGGAMYLVSTWTVGVLACTQGTCLSLA